MRPLFQRDSFVVLRFSQETLLERTGELEFLFFAAKGNHDHTFLYVDHGPGSKRLMYYADTGGNVGNIHRYRLRLLRSDWRGRHIGRTIGRHCMGSPARYNWLLGFLTRNDLFLWYILNFFVLVIRHGEIGFVRQIILTGSGCDLRGQKLPRHHVIILTRYHGAVKSDAFPGVAINASLNTLRDTSSSKSFTSRPVTFLKSSGSSCVITSFRLYSR
ncbi:unknown [Firmicutes bacterium CAG:170]|nr:unknown [Firmicutes bacterium CAG:170]